MIRLTAQIDSNLAKLAGKQLPYVTSVALNRTAIGARDLVRENLPKRFQLRNHWTKGGIQARTSDKTNLMARVLAPEYMLIQETGGTREPTKSKLLAAPAESMQSNRITPKANKPRALLSDRAFILDMGGGDAGVFLRYGKKRSQIKLLWWLSDNQAYEDRFQFETDVRDYVQDRFSSNFIAAMTAALEEGRYMDVTPGTRGRKRNARPEGMSSRAWRRQQDRGG